MVRTAAAGAATAWAPGTWGELVQGTIDGIDVMITCPVNRFVLAEAGPEPGCGQWQAPPDYPKVQAALAHMPGSGTIRIISPLRRGAGMASSTADICAALTAAAAAGGRRLSAQGLWRRCLDLEPTDGLMFPGLALVDHRRGRCLKLLGSPPPVAIIGVDPGGTVSTRRFNARADLATANRKKERQIRAAVELAIEAIATRNAAALGAAATLSAEAHQAILPNPLWERAAAVAKACRAAGVNVGHSGTVLGFLFDPNITEMTDVLAWIKRQLNLPAVSLKLIGGGITVCTHKTRLTTAATFGPPLAASAATSPKSAISVPRLIL